MKEMHSSILFLWIIETSNILWRANTTESELLSFRTLLKSFSLLSTSFKGCPVCPVTHTSSHPYHTPFRVANPWSLWGNLMDRAESHLATTKIHPLILEIYTQTKCFLPPLGNPFSQDHSSSPAVLKVRSWGWEGPWDPSSGLHAFITIQLKVYLPSLLCQHWHHRDKSNSSRLKC